MRHLALNLQTVLCCKIRRNKLLHNYKIYTREATTERGDKMMLGEEKTKTLSLCSFTFLLIKMKWIILNISLLVKSAFLLNPQVVVLTHTDCAAMRQVLMQTSCIHDCAIICKWIWSSCFGTKLFNYWNFTKRCICIKSAFSTKIEFTNFIWFAVKHYVPKVC